MNTGTIHCRDAVYWVRATLKFSMRFSNELAWKAIIRVSMYSWNWLHVFSPFLHLLLLQVRRGGVLEPARVKHQD